MVTLAWGNVLSLVLPGALVVLAARRLDPVIGGLLSDPNKLSIPGAVFLVLFATLAGGILEALRRITFDLWLSRYVNPKRPNIYRYLTPENMALFQTGVENSYKYYTFYGNLLWSILCVVAIRLYSGAGSRLELLLLATAVVLGRAAQIQYRAFDNRLDGFIAVEKLRRQEGTDAKE